MNKQNTGWVFACIFAALALVLFLNLQKQTSNIKPAVSDPNTLTIKFNDKTEDLIVYNYKGEKVPPAKLNEKDPIGDLFRHAASTNLRFKGSASAIVAHTEVNPSCNPTIVIGSVCYAPHTWCCPGS